MVEFCIVRNTTLGKDVSSLWDLRTCLCCTFVCLYALPCWIALLLAKPYSRGESVWLMPGLCPSTVSNGHKSHQIPWSYSAHRNSTLLPTDDGVMLPFPPDGHFKFSILWYEFIKVHLGPDPVQLSDTKAFPRYGNKKKLFYNDKGPSVTTPSTKMPPNKVGKLDMSNASKMMPLPKLSLFWI